MNDVKKSPLPILLTGPIVRHCDFKQLNFWLVTSISCSLHCRLINKQEQTILFNEELSTQCEEVQIGRHAFIQLISITLEIPLVDVTTIEYDFTILNEEHTYSLHHEASYLLYDSNELPHFIVSNSANNILHGSCRKPHFPSKDGLAIVDDIIANSITKNSIDNTRPTFLMMSGDQVYCDDVAGPMLTGIHQLIQQLGLFDEHWENPENISIQNAGSLYKHPNSYYHRAHILPKQPIKQSLFNILSSGKTAPIFSSVSAHNHLITVAEVFAMYLLVWSPTPWTLINLQDTTHIPVDSKAQYDDELIIIERFIATLPKVSRALAHIPCYMIFDDHDITDDWNLTRGWEEAAYGHPFSHRIIGNALIAYFLCQGWGNAPKHFTEPLKKAQLVFTQQGINHPEQNELIIQLHRFNHWHYELNTTPKVVVLNTRTERWRSESNANKPSGLMDWESLCSLQAELIDQPSVIMVSPAPIYGIKIIETIQRIFTFLGKPLAVDAENWMAHKGTANVILNIFRHHKTPPHFIILSGDVHYSFVYKISHRFIRTNSTITQITCSGIKNAFPDKLIKNLERLNEYLYGRYSPLNWFTQRRRMRITTQAPKKLDEQIDKQSKHLLSSKTIHRGCLYNSLYNGSAIGQLIIHNENTVDARIVTAEGDVITFESKEQ